MFRHQISTMGILLDYKIIDPVLLKAAMIHDLFESAAGMPGVSRDAIAGIDSDVCFANIPNVGDSPTQTLLPQTIGTLLVRRDAFSGSSPKQRFRTTPPSPSDLEKRVSRQERTGVAAMSRGVPMEESIRDLKTKPGMSDEDIR